MAPTFDLADAPRLDNISSNETIYQRFVLVTGTAGSLSLQLSQSPFISVETPSFPVQTFPCSPETGAFRALVHLQPGPQDIKFSFNGGGSEETSTIVTGVMYLPLLHVPPLHLAIMVAEDSPMFMDCPPEKAASPTHRDFMAAVKKMRMWAYMCQALTAEEMRRNGLGRRSFRLEEEWTQDTLSIWDEEPKFRMTAKVHIVKADVKTGFLRDPNFAQQNPNARQSGHLYNIFHTALQKYGGPFEAFKSDPHGPVVAGLILDSHYDPSQDLILAHAALGGTGGPFSKVHLGMFGSHTHWAWPRFVEEIAPSLLDATRVTVKSRVGNDNGECGTFWETCCIGQGAALHEAGHAFGLPHQTSGIMSRGYVEWNRSFVAKESYCVRTKESAKDSVPLVTSNHWHLADLLHMAAHHMFILPHDPPVKQRTPLSIQAGPQQVTITSKAGIALLEWQAEGKQAISEDVRSKDDRVEKLELTFEGLQNRFGGYSDALNTQEDGKAARANPKVAKKLTLVATALDGAQKTIDDFWDFAVSTCVPIPGSDLTIRQKSIISSQASRQGVWKWAVLLTKLRKDGSIVKAKRIQIQKGLWFDGCYVFYDDDSKDVMGPKTFPSGGAKYLGGGTTNMTLEPEEIITYVEVWSGGYIDAVQFHTSKKPGGIGQRHGGAGEKLEADEGEQIVGFYGKNEHDGGFCATLEFGILTMPKDATLPEQAYTLPALLNIDGGAQVNHNTQDDAEDYEDEGSEMDEDEDGHGEDEGEDDDHGSVVIEQHGDTTRYVVVG